MSRTILGILVVYFAVSFAILMSAYFFPSKGESITSVPILVSVFALIPIYVWYTKYAQKHAQLSKEVIPRNKSKSVFWIFAVFVLALSIRIPSVLVFAEPYEKTSVILLTVLVIVIVEKTGLSAFGFTTRKFGKSIVYGFLFFLLMNVLTLVLTYVLAFVFTGQNPLYTYDLSPFLLTFPFMTLCVGISEEGLFRGYIQTHVERAFTARKAILFQAVLFGVWHFVWNLSPFNPAAMAEYVATTLFIGLFFGYFYSKARSLTPLIFAHGLWDSFPQGIRENTAALDALGTLPFTSVILITILPYVVTIILTVLFVKYSVENLRAQVNVSLSSSIA